jgi:hypothetical protein
MPSGGRLRSGGAAASTETLAAVQTATDGGAMGAQAFVDHVGGDLGPDAIDHRAGGVIGRAKLRRTPPPASRSASLTVTGCRRLWRRDQDRVRRPGRLAWALDMWRTPRSAERAGPDY